MKLLATNTRAVQTREDIEVADPAAPLEMWELFDAPANLTRLERGKFRRKLFVPLCAKALA